MNIQLIRWTGLAGMLAGVIIAVGVFVDLAFPGSGMLVILLATAGILGIFFVVRGENQGRLALLGALGLIIGTLLLITSQNLPLTGIFYAAGLLVLVASMHRTGKFPLWVLAVLALAPILGVLGFSIEMANELFQQAGAVLLGLGFIGAGFTIWTGEG